MKAAYVSKHGLFVLDCAHITIMTYAGLHDPYDKMQGHTHGGFTWSPAKTAISGNLDDVKAFNTSTILTIIMTSVKRRKKKPLTLTQLYLSL